MVGIWYPPFSVGQAPPISYSRLTTLLETYPDFSGQETLKEELTRGETYQTKNEIRQVIIRECHMRKMRDEDGG